MWRFGEVGRGSDVTTTLLLFLVVQHNRKLPRLPRPLRHTKEGKSQYTHTFFLRYSLYFKIKVSFISQNLKHESSGIRQSQFHPVLSKVLQTQLHIPSLIVNIKM